MGTPKTEQEVKVEIAALREMKPFVRHFSAFGDDNHAKIDAQNKALEEKMDEDDVYNEWPDSGDYELLNNAQDAINWRDGESESEDGSPSQQWAILDSRKQEKS